MISLADGAGSASHSELGAELVTTISSEYLLENFNTMFNDSAKEIGESLLELLRSKSQEKAGQLDLSLKQLSSTIQFVGIKKNLFIAGHIGDGVIGKFKPGEIEVFSPPDNGEFLNQTYFFTSADALEHFRIYKGKFDGSIGFILMSDGSAESLFSRSNQQLTSANLKIFDWLMEYPEDEVNAALDNNIKEFFLKKTGDDCSVGVLLAIKSKDIVWWKKLIRRIPLIGPLFEKS